LYILTIDLILLTATLINDRPVLSSERASNVRRTEMFKQKEISGHEPQMGFDTNTNRLTENCNVTLTLLYKHCGAGIA
jgi:hypothetical protein